MRGIAAALTPVPGGVGSVTTSLLLLHTTEAARKQSQAAVAVAADPPGSMTGAPKISSMDILDGL